MGLKEKLDFKVFRERTRQFLIGLFVIFFFIGVFYMAQGGIINSISGLVVLIFSLIGILVAFIYT